MLRLFIEKDFESKGRKGKTKIKIKSIKISICVENMN